VSPASSGSPGHRRDGGRVEVVLAVDAGTTGVTVLMVTAEAEVLSRGYAEFAQHFPRPGWVEHTPEEIWQATQTATRVALDAAPDAVVQAVGITNQRETAVLWDRHTLAAPRRAIVWQDRRTAAICERLESEGHGARVTELTGLRLDPYFTGTKLTWLRENDARAWAGVESGQVAVGTVDSYLVARMTSGAAHLTDASNASRTLLYDVQQGGWSAELCDLLGVPIGALPEVVPNWGEVARTDPSAFCGIDAPISGMAGDQQAALFGQACFGVGDAKCTYGTGSFILVNTGKTLQRSDAGLLSTVAWQSPAGDLTYALEGAIFVTGAAIQWLRDGLQIIGSAAETAAIANTVRTSAGVVFVPALTGLGAPHWDPQARGSIHGITRGTTRAHLVRATLEAITYEVRDVFDTIATPIPVLRVDGGASQNALLMQMQADQLGVPVERPRIAETTGLGAAFLAGLGTGVWSSQNEIAATWALERRFEPAPAAAKAADTAYRQWLKAVERSKGWEERPGR
jgi:glycerol kinase